MDNDEPMVKIEVPSPEWTAAGKTITVHGAFLPDGWYSFKDGEFVKAD